MITRRRILSSLAVLAAGIMLPAAYAIGVEPTSRVDIRRYALRPPRWPEGERLRVVMLADLHACEPWMSEARIRSIVARANGLGGDIVLLLGDYVAGMRRFRREQVPIPVWAAELGRLEAPLGIHAVLGNHDWAEPGAGEACMAALAGEGIRVYENDAVRLGGGGHPAFWLAGLGDQVAERHDLGLTLSRVEDDDVPLILMAHEPDIFPDVPERVSLTLSGHTHGGQIALPIFGRPVVPSRFGQRYAYGHVVEEDRHLVVSGGLGCSIVPVRFGCPPEIVVLDLG